MVLLERLSSRMYSVIMSGQRASFRVAGTLNFDLETFGWPSQSPSPVADTIALQPWLVGLFHDPYFYDRC